MQNCLKRLLESVISLLDYHKTIDFKNCVYKPTRTINGFHKRLYEWKFGSQYWGKNKDKILKINSISDVGGKYGNDALVSLIYWSHIFDPFGYPIFDQRILRTFLLLSSIKCNIHDAPHFLWIGGVPSGKMFFDFYEDYYKVFISNKLKEIKDAKEKFLSLRKIDWALFGFDKYIISESIGNILLLDKTINILVSDRLKQIQTTKWIIIV